MKKNILQLDYDAIRRRIEKLKNDFKPGVWADMVGVSVNVISNIHGKTGQNPSLEYIIAVAQATNQSIEYFLWGDESEFKSEEQTNYFILKSQNLLKKFKNPEIVKELIENLLILEDTDLKGFEEINKIVKMKLEANISASGKEDQQRKKIS